MRHHGSRIFCLAASALLLSAQQPIVDQIIENYSKLVARIDLDRQIYFPGEEIVLSIAVHNPTARPLRVATPFEASTGYFGMREHQEDGTWRNMNQSQSTDFLMDSSTPNITLNAGEERRLSGKSTDPVPNGSTLARLPGNAPTQPGTYQYFYDMGGGRRNFRVVNPFFETAAETKVQADLIVTEDGQTYVMPQYLHVFSVQWDQISYICVSRPLYH